MLPYILFYSICCLFIYHDLTIPPLRGKGVYAVLALSLYPSIRNKFVLFSSRITDDNHLNLSQRRPQQSDPNLAYQFHTYFLFTDLVCVLIFLVKYEIIRLISFSSKTSVDIHLMFRVQPPQGILHPAYQFHTCTTSTFYLTT